MKNEYEKALLIGTNRRGRDVTKEVEVIERYDNGNPSKIMEREVRNIVGCTGKMNRYMWVNGFGDCYSINHGKRYTVYTDTYFTTKEEIEDDEKAEQRYYDEYMLNQSYMEV